MRMSLWTLQTTVTGKIPYTICSLNSNTSAAYTYMKNQVGPYPAGPTGTLVSNLLQSGTVGPVFSGVKFLRQVEGSSILNPAEENIPYHSVTLQHTTALCPFTLLPSM